MSLKATGDNVVIKMDVVSNMTKGGLFLPDGSKEKAKQGTVFSMGNGKVLSNGTRVLPSYKLGDKVAVSSCLGAEIKEDGVDYLILAQDDILAVIE